MQIFYKIFEILKEQGVIRIFLNIFFFLAILLPAFQYFFGVFPRTSLVDTPMEKKFPNFSLTALSKDQLQPHLERWLMHNNGLFGWMIKTGNTINYNVFNIASSRYNNRTYISKDKALFDKIYLNDLNGRYISKVPNPEQHAKVIKNLQLFMTNQGKAFLLVIHPNKAKLHPEWVDKSHHLALPRTDYISQLRHYLQKFEINHLIIADHLDPKQKYFVKSGAHLNDYGKCISTQLILSKLKTQLDPELLPDFECQLTGKNTRPKGEDLDLANLLNVWDYSASLDSVPEMQLKINYLPKNNLKALFVGTSYCMGILELLDKVHAFSDVNFLFYNKTHYYSRNKYTAKEKKGKKHFSKRTHQPKFIENHDLFVLESTDARLHQLGFGVLKNFED